MKLMRELLGLNEDDANATPAAPTTQQAMPQGSGSSQQAPAPQAAKPAPTKPEPPKEIAKAGDFRVLLGQNEQVSIVDAEGKIRLSMPLVVFKDLCRQS